MGARLFHWIGVGVISGSSGNMCLCDALEARLQSADGKRAGKLKGGIRIESETDKGTRILVRIPYKE